MIHDFRFCCAQYRNHKSQNCPELVERSETLNPMSRQAVKHDIRKDHRDLPRGKPTIGRVPLIEPVAHSENRQRDHPGIQRAEMPARHSFLENLFDQARVLFAFGAHFGMIAIAQRAALGQVDGIGVELIAQRDEM